jgi:hypothetical protein
MKLMSWKAWLGISLIAASGLLYWLNFLIFRDVNYMLRLFLAQLGFLPISVLLVTIFINQLLTQRARQDKLAKLNMVIGAFFSEVGFSLLRMLAAWDQGAERLRDAAAALASWSDQDFLHFRQGLDRYEGRLALNGGDLETLKAFLRERRDFFLRLLENPNLLEHDSFSNLLLAVFHLTEELILRPEPTRLAPPDQAHLAADAKRAYVLLIAEWATYLGYLKQRYPYLFSLAVRTNPFDPYTTVEIKE